jgi:chorismate synthase
MDIGNPEVCHMKSFEAQDEIVPDEAYPWITRRATNNAGGLEGGCTNGEPLIICAKLKPIPTSDMPLASIDLKSRVGSRTTPVRHDTCPVMAAAVILENMLALVLADATLEKFGGDTLDDVIAARNHYLSRLKGEGESEDEGSSD